MPHPLQGFISVLLKQFNPLCQYNSADIIKNTHDDMLILLFCLRANNFNSPSGRESECVCVSVCIKDRKWEHGEMMGECKRHFSDEEAPGGKLLLSTLVLVLRVTCRESSRYHTRTDPCVHIYTHIEKICSNTSQLSILKYAYWCWCCKVKRFKVPEQGTERTKLTEKATQSW